MCGIYAMNGQISDEQMNQVLKSMTHRGPDESGTHTLGQFQLGHQRLSIIGLEDGIQPITNEQRDQWIVCNGEIYNYQSLKASLKGQTAFLTESDSEVALRLYEVSGAGAIDQLDGMFAFFIADEQQNTFLAARDTLGIKPLYYGYDADGGMVFASELKTVYLVSETAQEFPPGHYYTPETGFVCYREIQRTTDSTDNHPDTYREGIRKYLTQAVEKRMLADVDVGVLLSGGLDSSLIAAITAKLRNKNNHTPLKSFCVGSEGSEDIKRAREVAQAIGTEHYEYIYTEKEIINILPDVIGHLESFEPSLVRSALPNYFVSKLASQHVKVILSGEGADELFAGYDYLNQFQTTASLNEEILRIIQSLHNINLQRADRMSMAHSLELRVPFLDLDLIQQALKIPAGLKLHKEARMEKAILREAFDGWLPDHVLWRKKEEFSAGSGALDILERYANEVITDSDWNKLNAQAPISLRSKQECLYFKIFQDRFPKPSAIETVGRWATA
ncbi:asparagine synthase B [Tuberibacillus sp. Marseille-P3662]|uniref:asparagine synthase B n=1 Tax=Tuberibacillus sp. Marseille-P3662 TaxID=1965358 RepID=UPI000A1CEF72|nr:asparagine synthase B [Tuberibacillus sp. Marseille-P3662]